MKKIGTVSKTKEITSKYTFLMKKKFGQNFLIDQNILEGIIKASDINKNTAVIEIGPGIGSLTEHLAENAGKVLSYEIDDTLLPILKETVGDYDNLTIVNKDFLEADVISDINTYLSGYENIYLVANLPYYITTPIIMHLLENVPQVKKYTMMMQLEVADRITAAKGVKDYNNLSIAIQYRAKVKKAMFVSKNVFMPAPNVNSAVVVFDIYDEAPVKAKDEKFFFSFVRSSFQNRRKTLVNNINANYGMPKDKIESILSENNISTSIRSEALSIEEFVMLSDIFSKLVTK